MISKQGWNSPWLPTFYWAINWVDSKTIWGFKYSANSMISTVCRRCGAMTSPLRLLSTKSYRWQSYHLGPAQWKAHRIHSLHLALIFPVTNNLPADFPYSRCQRLEIVILLVQHSHESVPTVGQLMIHEIISHRVPTLGLALGTE